MARHARLVVPGELHLVAQRARLGGIVFHDGADRRAWREAAALAARETGVALHGFGLQPAEVRVLATPPDASALARFMQAIGRRYVRGYNDRHGASGTPFEGRFRSCVVEPERCLAALRWVETDGRAGELEEEAHASSAGAHVGRWSDPVLTDPPAIWRLGNTPFEREAAWRRWLEAGAEAAETAAIRRCVGSGGVLGSPAFAERLAAAAGRPVLRRPRGRPPTVRVG